MKNQELLLKTINKKSDKKQSLIEVISSVLNISYDAAHRRVSMKSKFSIEEAVQLCLQFNISMDEIIRPTNKIVIEKTSDINNFSDLGLYLKDSYHHLKDFKEKKDVKIYYSAKDIPIFYTIGNTLLSKFKLYIWSNLLLGKDNCSPFEKFHITESIQEYSFELQSIYNSFDVHEIWNDTTINSIVQQIFYFFEAGLLKRESALMLYQDVISIMTKLEEKSSDNNTNFTIYYNELMILNNNVLVGNDEKMKLFVPYTMLGYFIVNEENTISNTTNFIQHQIKNSKNLNLSGTRDRKLFFNKALQKIDWYINKIENYLTENNF